MFQVIMYFILFMLLAALCAISIFKNFLSQYKMSSNGFITVLVLLIVLAALLYSLGGLLATSNLQEAIIRLNASSNISPDELESLRKAIELAPGQLTRLLGMGFAFFAVHFIIIKIIQRNIDNTIKKNAEKRWKI